MRFLVGRLVDVREGERTPALRAGLILFLLIAGHTVLETARDALFLERLAPSRLTLVYGLIAALALALAPASTALARRFGRRNALITVLLLAAYGTALFYVQPLGPRGVFALYAWSGLLGTVLVMQFWLFASELLTVAQGKRLFGPITAGGVLGAVAGASASAGLLLRLPVTALLPLAAACFVAASLVLTATWTEPLSVARQGSSARHAWRAALELFSHQSYVRRLAMLVVLSSAALLSLDYLFKASVTRHVPPAELGSFFAAYYAVLNAGSLLMQLFVSGPLIRRLGVVPALAVLPALLVVGGAATAFAGVSLAVVLVLKASDGMFRYSVHRVASELLEMPLPPRVHEQTKAFVDGPLPRLTQALTAGVLLALSAGEVHYERSVLLLGTGLSVGWLAVVFGLRAPYLERLREALSKPAFGPRGWMGNLDLDSVEAVLEALSSPEPTRVLGALDLLAEKKRVRLIPALVLYHENETVIQHALEIFGTSSREDWLSHSERLLAHRSPEVRAAVVQALSRHGRHVALERALGDPSPLVQAYALFWMLSLEQQPAPLSDPRLQALLDLPGEAGTQARWALLSAIRAAPHARWSEVLIAFGQADSATFERVALAMAAVRDVRFVPLLVPRLDMRDGRAAVREALVALGDPALSALAQAFEDARTPGRVRAHIPRTVSRFRSQAAADLLVEWLDSERPGALRYKALRGLGRLVMESRGVRVDRARIARQIHRNLVEHLRVLSLKRPLATRTEDGRGARSLRLVVGLLDDKLEHSLERAFRLLQIRHKHEDLRSVYFASRSPEKVRRAHAIEFLDVLTALSDTGSPNQRVRDLLLLAIDDLSMDERLERAREFVPDQPASYAEALELLLADQDDSLAAFAAYHALEVGSAELESAVAGALRDRPELGRDSGRAALFPPLLGVTHAH